MTKSEELVYKLCTKSFLSMWSYPNPKGKKGKELCDILVVCDPDIVIFSVKEIEFKDTGNNVGWERWRKKAVDESSNQIYGAERWINSNLDVISQEGKKCLPFPNISNRRIHRIAIALGSKGKIPVPLIDYKEEFIHILTENSLDILLNELDTIIDFVNYLLEKEQFLKSGVLPIISGGEEDLLAFYLSENRKFPKNFDTVVLDDNLWNGFSKEKVYLSKKESDKISYVWDTIIEEIYQTYISNNLIEDETFSNELTDIEKALRIMAREDRFARRRISMSLVDFLQNSKSQNIKARISPNSSCESDVMYVFQISNYDGNRQINFDELQMRCIVARGLNQNKKKIIGILAEFSDVVEGAATSVCLLEIDEWTEDLEQKMNIIQNELGYFSKPKETKFSNDEFTKEYPNFEQ